MESKMSKSNFRLANLFFLLAIGVFAFFSCSDDYDLDDKEPEWLGANIYDYLKEDGEFTYFVKLIEDLDYKEVMQLTGFKTLFVAKDSSFNEFFKSNEWGVKNYDELSLAQKKLIFNFSTINNAYLLEKMSNYYSGGVTYEGTAMRRATALSPYDSLAFNIGDELPKSKYWDYYRENGIYLMKDETLVPMVYFSQQFINKYAISNDDFNLLSGGKTRQRNDFHVFNKKVLKRDIVCKNGYIHVLEDVLVPPKNMAQFIHDQPNTKIFSKILDRFCIPVYSAEITNKYRELYPESNIDSIFVKRYIATLGGTTRLPNGQTAVNQLTFDPGWNSFSASSIYADIATMFIPTDEAMNEYLNSGVGAILKERYQSWDSIPDNIILPFVKRHMRTSLIESVPSRFDRMVDAENYALPVTKNHIVDAYTAVNGQVYLTNSVYPPVDYISVYSPVLLSKNSRIMDWAINISETSVDGTRFAFYKLYLNSLVSRYSLFVPTDEYFEHYLDPIAYGQDVPGVIKFWYNTLTAKVNATVYKYDKATDTVGDSIDVITSDAFLKNRLWDLMDSHIVVGDVETGNSYYVTKANDMIKVTGSGTSMVIKGGTNSNTQSKVLTKYSQYNGNTYFIDNPIQTARKSVYKTLSEKSEFSAFFELLNGVPDTSVQQIFAQQGIDYRVRFFNAYRYTVYVPSNAAIQAAITSGKIKPWEQIYNIADPTQKSIEIQKMIRILKYHFQDNAVFYGQHIDEEYLSATLKTNTTPTYWGTSINKYYKIGVKANGGPLTLTTERNEKAYVTSDPTLHNIITKDYIFARLPSQYKNIDGTSVNASNPLFNTSLITTSASAVIHQIDNVLTFE